MNCEINRTIEQCGFDFQCKHAFATNRGQRRSLIFVARRANDAFFNHEILVRRFELSRELSRLRQCQRTATRAHDDSGL